MRARVFVALAMAGALSMATVAAGGGVADAQRNDRIDRDARLRFGLNMAGGGFSQRLNPPQMTVICDVVVGQQIFSTLIRRDTRTGATEPGLAESWRMVDPNTFEFTLRPNLTFHDGTRLDAAAAKAALDVMRVPPSRLVGVLGVISSVEAGADGRTVTLRLAQPVAGIMPLTLASREGMIMAAASTDANPIGAGPFKFDSQVVGQEIRLSRFPGYWNARNVRLAGIDYLHTEDASTGVNSVLAGDLDVTAAGGLANAPAENRPDVRIVERRGEDWHRLIMNTAKPPFDNVWFRRALNYAMPKEAIGRALFGDDFDIATQMYPRHLEDQYQEHLADRYPFSMRKARQAMRRSGVQTPVTVEALVPAASPELIRLAEIVQTQLRELGVNVEITPSPNTHAAFNINKQGHFSPSMGIARPDPSVAIQRNFAPNQVGNVGNNLSPGIAEALARIQAARTPAEARAGYREAVEIIVDQAYDVPLVFGRVAFVHRRNVVSNDWQIPGFCQGVDFSRLAITRDRR